MLPRRAAKACKIQGRGDDAAALFFLISLGNLAQKTLHLVDVPANDRHGSRGACAERRHLTTCRIAGLQGERLLMRGQLLLQIDAMPAAAGERG